MVIRGNRCCGYSKSAGVTFTVEGFCESSGICAGCKTPISGLTTAGNRMFYIYKLKRIPPLSELDDVKRDEEITA